MSAEAVSFVRRHLLATVTTPQGLYLMTIADRANRVGRARVTQPMLAAELGRRLRTVEYHMRELLRPAKGEPLLIKGGGRTYVIVGVAEHDSRYCWHPECIADVHERRQRRRRRPNG